VAPVVGSTARWVLPNRLRITESLPKPAHHLVDRNGLHPAGIDVDDAPLNLVFNRSWPRAL